jgi:hypothetical protein
MSRRGYCARFACAWTLGAYGKRYSTSHRRASSAGRTEEIPTASAVPLGIGKIPIFAVSKNPVEAGQP